MRVTWLWLFSAAIAHLTGRILALPGSNSVAVTQTASMNDLGRILSGPLQMSMLLGGLTHLLMAWRRMGIIRRLTRGDYALLLIVGGLTIRTVYAIHAYVSEAKTITFLTAALWTSDPLLMGLLVVAILVRRAVNPLGHGLLTNWWRSYVAAAAIMSFGNAMSWCLECSNYEAWVSLSWFVWLPGDTMYALAPAFQIAALQHARNRAQVFEAFCEARFWRIP
jgi:hypothetical protein